MSDSLIKFAEELSLVEKVVVKKKKNKKPQKLQVHNYKYLIIIDFEATCWDGYNLYGNNRNKVKQEIIEFPAVVSIYKKSTIYRFL